MGKPFPGALQEERSLEIKMSEEGLHPSEKNPAVIHCPTQWARERCLGDWHPTGNEKSSS